jgi:hypothetical protein
LGAHSTVNIKIEAKHTLAGIYSSSCMSRRQGGAHV